MHFRNIQYSIFNIHVQVIKTERACFCCTIHLMDSSMTSLLLERLFVAGLLGAIIGAERDYSGRPAGIRTNLLISVSSCLFTLISLVAFVGNDPRIAAQIVTGVGFLGAGALLHNKDHVMGLTTAADIWLVSAVGMAVGVGYYTVAFSVAILTVLVLLLLAPISHFLSEAGRNRTKSIRKEKAG